MFKFLHLRGFEIRLLPWICRAIGPTYQAEQLDTSRARNSVVPFLASFEACVGVNHGFPRQEKAGHLSSWYQAA